jgi:hypothetical protein
LHQRPRRVHSAGPAGKAKAPRNRSPGGLAMTSSSRPTPGLNRKKRRPRLTMRLHPHEGDLSADATGRKSLCRHPQFLAAALAGCASKWTNVVRSVRSFHSPNPLARSQRPGQDPAVAPKGAPVDPARLGCRSTAGRKPAGLTTTGPPSAGRPEGQPLPAFRGSAVEPQPHEGIRSQAFPRRTTRVPSSLVTQFAPTRISPRSPVLRYNPPVPVTRSPRASRGL